MSESLPSSRKADQVMVLLDVRTKRDDYEERVDFFFGRVFAMAPEFGCAAVCEADDTGEPMVLLIAGETTSRPQLRACLDQVLTAVAGSFEFVGVETKANFDLHE